MKNIKDLILKAKGKDNNAFEDLSLIWRTKAGLTQEEINLINIDRDLRNRLEHRIKGSGTHGIIKTTECITRVLNINNE